MRSLDGQMEAWCKGTLVALSPQNISAAVYSGIKSHVENPIAYAERSTRIVGIISASSDLFHEIIAYENRLNTRKHQVIDTYDDIRAAWKRWEEDGKGEMERSKALQIGGWANAFRVALARDVDVEPDKVEYLLFSELMDVVQEAI